MPLGVEVNGVSCSRRCLKRLSCKFESMEGYQLKGLLGGEPVAVEGLREVLGNMELPLREERSPCLPQLMQVGDSIRPVISHFLMKWALR
ncbi:hypothetical protein CEXT_220871 [Caerostris extrusa]|uniref:Uncharacterized protein n=1 Tax=Caerostris extrusa TaxID=172846 RepID=A0AAV4URQ5_CAEEX|nr:hypothetical protein CEXT_220871 [Caerostris extrusa]